jgi:NO-binding membrane sensor protein with MHYT domain
MFAGHDPYLVALSVVIAILGGYTGFGLAAVYLVLPTIISFLICALVVGISLFFVSIGEPSLLRVASSAVLLGAGIASMHYVGMHGLAGSFAMQHDDPMVLLSVLVAIVAAYGGLRAFLARQDGIRLIVSSIAFGVAVSGMHYTAMYGAHFMPMSAEGHHHGGSGLAASQQILSVVVALLCFVITAGFLLSLVPDPRRRAARDLAVEPSVDVSEIPSPGLGLIAAGGPRVISAPLGGLGQPPRAAPAARLPVEGADGTHFIDTANVRSVRADAHYTRVHDGTRERMCPWSISEAEAQLDPGLFVRVHRSHIVAIPHVSFVRKEGDGAVIELDGPSPHRVPVSRAKIAEVKARLGLIRRHA